MENLQEHFLVLPSGPLGIVLRQSNHSTGGYCVIESVATDSPVAGKLFPGDLITSVGPKSMKAWHAAAVCQELSNNAFNRFLRTMTVLRERPNAADSRTLNTPKKTTGSARSKRKRQDNYHATVNVPRGLTPIGFNSVASVGKTVGLNKPAEDEHRPAVKEELLRIYELKDGANVFERLLESDDLKQHPYAKAQLESLIKSQRDKASRIMKKYPDDTLNSWEMHFKRLVYFKLEHGHCLVPEIVNENLARWCNEQRQLYHTPNAFARSQPANYILPLSDNTDFLSRLGFEWSLENSL